MKTLIGSLFVLLALQAQAFACCYYDNECFVGFHCYSVGVCGQVGLGKCLWGRGRSEDFKSDSKGLLMIQKNNPSLEDSKVKSLFSNEQFTPYEKGCGANVKSIK